MVGNQDSNAGGAFEAKKAESALGYWGSAFDLMAMIVLSTRGQITPAHPKLAVVKLFLADRHFHSKDSLGTWP